MAAFKFVNGLETIKQVTFDITTKGELVKTIVFPRKVTKDQAIQAVERWLSRPVTEDYIKLVHQYIDVRKKYANRAECIGSEIRLVDAVEQQGNLSLLFFVYSD